jgi:hypothetical protein
VTRFKESKRIEAAIRFKSIVELQWSKRFCEHRLTLPNLPKHAESHWRRVTRVESALDEAERFKRPITQALSLRQTYYPTRERR